MHNPFPADGRSAGRFSRRIRACVLASLAACAAPFAHAQVTPVPPTTCGNLATAEFDGTFGTLPTSATVFGRDVQIPPGGGYLYGGSGTNSINPSSRYVVTSRDNSPSVHSSTVHWQSLPGHNNGSTTGIANDAYLAVNGSSAAAGVFYRQTVVLVPNQTYRLSMFAVNAINLVGYNGTLPNLRIRIVRVSDGVQVAQDDTGLLPDKEGAWVGPSDWTQANVDFNSGAATQFRIEVTNLVIQESDNDFAIDDVTIAPLTNAGCPIDFGDAPDAANGTAQGNYQSRLADNGARHGLVGGLFIGSTATPEADALQNATATGDADDGISGATSLALYAGQTVTVPVSVSNTTGANAFLNAFVDFNRDGDFLDAGESLSPVTIPSDAAVQTSNMSFTVPTSAVPGASFLRLRLANTGAQITTAIGAATRGEVEDYQVTLQPTVTLTKAWASPVNGDAVGLTVAGGTSATAGSSVAGGATTPARSVVATGATITLAEAFTSGSAVNYDTTLACAKNTDGTAVAVAGTGLSRTIVVPVDSPVTCTYTNTRRIADLLITKTNTPGVNGDVDQAADTVVSGAATTYTVRARNNGPGAANGAVAHDTSAAGLSGCTVTGCTPAGAASCPATPGDLLSPAGAVIPAFPSGGSVTFVVTCNVD